MPRLVSMTLLSLLALPASALMYTITIVVMLDQLGWQYDWLAWTLANIAGFATAAGLWTTVWFASVHWTRQRVGLTLLAAGAAGGAGVVVGVILNAMVDGFGHFAGGSTAILLWLAAAAVLWRQTPGERVALLAGTGTSASATIDVLCPSCGYSLRGLAEARCPECGGRYTLDALFTAQSPRPATGDLG